MAKIQVYAKKASALNIRHPIDGPLRPDGTGMWDQDGFTARRLQEGAITRDPAEAFKKLAAAAAPAQPAATDSAAQAAAAAIAQPQAAAQPAAPPAAAAPAAAKPQ